MKTPQEVKALCDQVRQVSYDIHVYHAHGHLEKVYENALEEIVVGALFADLAEVEDVDAVLH